MALKRKLTKAEHEALPEHLKTEYVEKGGNYVLDVDGDDDITPLKNANERNKSERDAAIRTAKELQDKLDAIDADKAKGDYDAMNKSWQTKYDKLQKEATDSLAKGQNHLSRILIDEQALKLANELSPKNAKVLAPLIKMRLAADFEGDSPMTKVLDADGKVSALTVAELKAEYIANPDYSGIIDGSKASGGASSSQTKTPSGAGNPNDKPINLATAPASQVRDQLADKVAAQLVGV